MIFRSFDATNKKPNTKNDAYKKENYCGDTPALYLYKKLWYSTPFLVYRAPLRNQNTFFEKWRRLEFLKQFGEKFQGLATSIFQYSKKIPDFSASCWGISRKNQ